MKQPSTPILRHQRGAATLMVALILLVSLTLLTLYAARVSVTEHQISANDYRAKQAFEAAEAGIEVAAASPLNGTHTQVSAPLPNTITGTLPNGATYTVVFGRPTPVNLQQILITSTGLSDDRTGRSVSQQMLQFRPFQINNVDAGILAMGNITMAGSSRANNGNIPGAFAARAGGNIEPGNGPNPFTGNTQTGGLPTNGNDFFKRIFGADKDTIQAQANQLTCSSSNCDTVLKGSTNPLIWLTGLGNTNITSHFTLGSIDNPVVLIIDGAYSITGNVTVYGLVYYTDTWARSPRGSATVHGATVVEGDITPTGNSTYNYNPDVLEEIGDDLGSFEKLAGGWRDF